MSVRTMAIVLLALVFGGSAAMGVKMVLAQRTGPAAVETVPVVVAVAEIPRGASVTADLVRIRDYPKGLVPPGSLGTVEEVVDRAVLGPLVADEPLLDGKLAPKGAGRGMSPLIPKGMRAFTVQTDVAAGVAGFILPGNRVDVLLTVSDSSDEETGGGSTTTLLQNVEILAVDQQMDAPSENKVDAQLMKSVTLLVEPGQAATLSLGQNKGKLHLSLRNLEDDAAGEVQPVTVNDIRFHQDKPQVDGEKVKALVGFLAAAMAPRAAPAVAPNAPEPPRPEQPRRLQVHQGTRQVAVHVFRSESASDGS